MSWGDRDKMKSRSSNAALAKISIEKQQERFAARLERDRQMMRECGFRC